MHQQSSKGEKEDGVKNVIQTIVLRDIFWVIIMILLICIAENDYLRNDPKLSIFAIIFEIVSAYGPVGLSLGYPGTAICLCGVFTTFSKCCIIFLMLIGRHRGLPETVDRAVRLPSRLARHVRQSRKEKTWIGNRISIDLRR